MSRQLRLYPLLSPASRVLHWQTYWHAGAFGARWLRRRCGCQVANAA